ncbi:phosphopantetheine-binding protein [Stigmatella sp. ncwal1]|uniref:Phosphopantetheine-binding protein n=1 Tax=Stigmatella ashevillensis TaxID=2995309 RepID=A0ABT5DE68_9BACT|nr:phosphopantetheine-binding protein [Stigmatella ashevillena]MDC0711354.1 phosphopantetheine-binding protein [Stigmatella ashevillena]
MSAQPAGILPSSPENPLAPPSEVGPIVTQLRRMIVHELDVRIQEEELTDDTSLIDGRLALDSIVLFELITLIEKRFGFEFSDQNLRMEVFASLTALAQHIHHATAQSKQAAAV